MNDDIHADLALERNAKERFGMDVDVDKVIARGIPVSHTAEATVFLTTKKQLLVYVTARSKQTLGDVKKIITRMGLRAELYFPPKGERQGVDYFDDIGHEKFREVFPGRNQVTAADLTYYRTLAPYNPALVLIHEVVGGEIKQFDTDARGSWRVTARFAYRRIKTS